MSIDNALDSVRSMTNAVTTGVNTVTRAAADLGLANIAEGKNDDKTARAEANSSLQLEQLAGAYLVLARSDAKANNLTTAIQRVDQALWLEPNNAEALALKHDLQSRQTFQ